MPYVDLTFSSGIPALDKVIQDFLPGDNVVLIVNNIEEYLPFVHRFAEKARIDKKELIYFRFAQHENLLSVEYNAEIYELKPEKGFDSFISQIISVIEQFGRGVCYVFDLLSDLTVDWYSDVMIGNFFMLACPYLYKYDTVAFFALIRNHHQENAILDIQNTAQVVLDIFSDQNQIYIHPIKIYNRYSPTLYMLHRWNSPNQPNESITPVKDSATTAEILAKNVQQWLDFRGKRQDAWHLTFRQAQETLEGILLGEISPVQAQSFQSRLLQMAVARDDLLFILGVQYLNLNDLLEIGRRLIGTGLIGGKSVGMLIAQAILRKKDPHWQEILEFHDSFYIGSEVFYTFLVKNDIWWMRRRICNPSTFLEGLEGAQQKILAGVFPDYILNRFQSMLDYFGQSPIIVRSSSIQEDAYGNSFSGKYESIFLANQGSPVERLQNFLNAVRRVYASSINRDALTYRKVRGLLEYDEQMAILVQRVSGSMYGDYFFPHIAGVGFSYNPYVWNEKIDPKAGVLRLVVGLGTHAVDRLDDDYTRVVALNIPTLRPETSFEQIQKVSQNLIDLLDLKVNRFMTYNFKKIQNSFDNNVLTLCCSRDKEIEARLEAQNRPMNLPWVVTFEELINKTHFIQDMRDILQTLQEAYQIPVDIEFTVNFTQNGQYRINLLQCRPFQVKREIQYVETPTNIPRDSIILETSGPIIGPSVATKIERLIYVVPLIYGHLSIQDRHAVAHLIGQINHHPSCQNKKILLMGPGRWGTSSPSLGIPTTFGEISNVNVLGEIAEMHEGLVPDVSLGTHFFNNIVELDINYFALHPDRDHNYINREFFLSHPNQLVSLIPTAENWQDAVKVVDVGSNSTDEEIHVIIDTINQKGICYIMNSHKF